MLLRDAMVLYSFLLADKPLRFPVFCNETPLQYRCCHVAEGSLMAACSQGLPAL